ncbi:hypothetical protein VCRA2117O380_90121 [Vibrio crassostreae]|nr:hypothetical protein EDB30_11075 [Vibrio crassostreae]CAK1817417.1 hypothetical protein VCRA2119O381_160022 [Vibrio crassostreae]CAK2239503.1 hypothetical protein VCRA2117O379_90121 [Vibrio crassostreae]CAK2240988.1 hypothetical protein VCRA2119O382_90120 [Vibrio crassostreae]CAK2246493.1 hypothetical protein VCRA2117O380_90121 [Vibrio crassostreae]
MILIGSVIITIFDKRIFGDVRKKYFTNLDGFSIYNSIKNPQTFSSVIHTAIDRNS